MATATKKAKTAKTKTAKAVKAASPKREANDERVSILLAALIKNPAASEADLAGVLKAKGKQMSGWAITLVRRGFRQTAKALAAHGLLTKELILG